MGIGKTVRKQAMKATNLLVAGHPVNPWLVEIDFATKGSSPKQVELHLGLPILLFEMQQCDVQVNEQTIVGFVEQEIKTHQGPALNGYLTIGRAIISPRPARKNNSWFSRVFTSPPKWTPPVPQWKWTSVSEISLSGDDALVVKGSCYWAGENEIA
jgi:hypothetical protein